MNKSSISVLQELMVKNKKPLPTYDCIEDTIFGCNSHKFTTRVTCDNVTVCGIGTTKKLAKENAAKEILTILKSPSDSKESGTDNVNNADEEIIKGKTGAIFFADSESTNTSSNSERKINKSSVAELQELVAKNKKSLPIYDCIEDKIVINNSHQFTTRVTCDNITTSGTGSNKKLAKENAAKNMLTIIKKPSSLEELEAKMFDNNMEELIGSLSTTSFSELENTMSSKDTKKTAKSPIAELQELMTIKRKSFPTYDCIQNKIIGNNLHEFTIKVACDNVIVCGTGSNKKKAKENAAKEMLKILKMTDGSKETEAENIDNDAEYIIDILSKRSLVDLESTVTSENSESKIMENAANEILTTIKVPSSSKEGGPEYVDNNDKEAIIKKCIAISSTEWESIVLSNDSEEETPSPVSILDDSVMINEISSPKYDNCTCDEGNIIEELFHGMENAKINDSNDSEKRPVSPINELIELKHTENTDTINGNTLNNDGRQRFLKRKNITGFDLFVEKGSFNMIVVPKVHHFGQ